MEWKDRKEGKTRGLEKRVNQKEEKRERLVEVGEGEGWEMWGKGGWMRGGERLKEGRMKCSDRGMCEMIHKLFGVG